MNNVLKIDLVLILQYFLSEFYSAINAINQFTSEKAMDGLTVSQFSSFYVEKTDFLRLDYLTFFYKIDPSNIEFIKKLRLQTTLENVFTLTNYSGVNSEPIFEDVGQIDSGQFYCGEPCELSPVIDCRNRYLPSRTMPFGVQLSL